MDMRIVLGSGSPRRRELMSQIGLDYEVLVSDAAEVTEATEPADICRELACLKARDVADRLARENADKGGSEGPGADRILVIGSDTIVAADGRILGKPADTEDARRMLRLISGREHQVYTGVAAVEVTGGRIVSETSFTDVTDVYVSHLTEEDIDWYLSTGEPFDKAGAYGIQGYFARFVVKIDGDYNTVVGLPVGRLWRDVIRHYER